LKKLLSSLKKLVALICKKIMEKFHSSGKTSSSLYERLGAGQTVARAVRIFYGKVIRDERISWMFVDSDWLKLREHWMNYLTVAFGGPVKYEGQLLLDVHCQVNNGKFPEEVHFHTVTENLISVLYELKVTQEDIDEVVRTVNSFKCYVVGCHETEVSKQDADEVPKECGLKKEKKWKMSFVYKVVNNTWKTLSNKIFYIMKQKKSPMNQEQKNTIFCRALNSGARSCKIAWSENMVSNLEPSQRSSIRRSSITSFFKRVREHASTSWRRSSVSTFRTFKPNSESTDLRRSTISSWNNESAWSEEFDTYSIMRSSKCSCDAEVAAEAVRKYL